MKLFRLTSILLIAVFLMSACGAQASTVSERLPLKVTWVVFNGYSPFFIAEGKGLFQKHGVQVQSVQTDTNEGELINLSGNAADCALIVFSGAIPLAATGGLKVVMVIDSTDGADQLIASSDINSVADLKGKRIGVGLGSYSELFVREILKKNGVSAGDVQFVNVAPETLADALGKTVDAGHTYDPFSSQALSQGYKQIASSADVPNLIFDAVVCNSSVVKTRPDDIRAFIAAWFEALTWWQGNVQEGNSIIAKATDQKPEDISTAGIKLFTLKDNQNAFDPNSPSSLFVAAKKTIDYYASISALTSAPDLNQLLDGSYLK